MNVSRWMTGLLCTAILCLGIGTAGVARGASDADALERLERIIQQQQAQIESQAKAIEQLKRQVETLVGQAGEAATERDRIVEKATPTTGAGAAPIEGSPAEGAPDPKAAPEEKAVRDRIVEEAATTTGVAAEPLNERTGVRTGSDKVSVQLYGQVNKAVLATDDGNEDNWYIVDNSNSSTRIGLRGVARPTGDLEAGTRIEVQFQTNPSNKVSQIDKNGVGTDSFTKRWFDAYLASKRFGEVRLGHGSTVSDGTSEVDLSGTAVIGYSSVSDMAGGHFFYDSAGNALTTTRVSHVFSDMDGLGRDDRFLYKTPEFYGFKAGASWISGGSSDIILGYASKWGPFAVGAAMAYASYGSNSVIIDNQVNGSASVLHESGLNFTFAAGNRNFNLAGRDDATFTYGKLGYRSDFFQFGETAVAVDLARNTDLSANEDVADSFGLFGVQNFEKWGTEYYLGYRNYRLDRPGLDANPIDAVMTGVRVKF